MARSLPLFIKPSTTSVTASSSTPSSTTALSYGQAGVQIVGATAGISSVGGKVTLTIRDGDNMTTSPVVYSVEFDFTSVQGTADMQTTPIPCFEAPTFTVQADSTANGKTFSFGLALQKISVEG